MAAALNPEAPSFIPMQNSQLVSPRPSPSLPLHFMPEPNSPIFFFSTAPPPTYPYFVDFFGRPPLFVDVPPQRHDKAVFASRPGDVACMVINHAWYSNHHRYVVGRDGAGGDCSFREAPKEKKMYRKKSRKCDYIRADVGEGRRTAGCKKVRRNEKAKPVLPVSEDENYTTIMVRNIPSKYTRVMLLEFLDQHCKNENEQSNDRIPGDGEEVEAVSAFDFLYLPIDFNTGVNKGYAFVNFTTTTAARKFSVAADNQTWDLCKSKKIRRIARARLQGKEELVRHFENMGFPCQTDEVLPVSFTPAHDGSGKLVKETTVGRIIGGRSKKSGEDETRSNKSAATTCILGI